MGTLQAGPEITFGDRLRRLRITLGMDQRSFAEELGVDHTTISRYEYNGVPGNAGRRLALQVQGRWGIDAGWLLSGQVTGEKLAAFAAKVLRLPLRATQLVRRGVALTTVSKMMRHRSVRTTQRYVLTDDSDMIAALRLMEENDG